MGFGRQKILVNVGAVNFGQPESLYQSEITQTIASAGNFVIPSGYQYVTGDGAGAQLQYSPNAANATPTWRQFNSMGYCGLVDTDGFAWRVHNNATTAITIWYFTLS